MIVPVYNAQNFLEKCIESLTQQTLKEMELIFVNDGSTDQSLQILEKYQKRFPKKVMVYSKENGGQASARNLGIAKVVENILDSLMQMIMLIRICMKQCIRRRRKKIVIM